MSLHDCVDPKAGRRMEKWVVKWSRGQAEFLADPERRAAAAERRRQTMQMKAAVYEQVARMLEAAGVARIQWPFYQQFAWDMWRQRFKDLGLAHLALEADIAVNGWVARGLGRSMLESICMQLFGVRPGEDVRE